MGRKQGVGHRTNDGGRGKGEETGRHTRDIRVVGVTWRANGGGSSNLSPGAYTGVGSKDFAQPHLSKKLRAGAAHFLRLLTGRPTSLENPVSAPVHQPRQTAAFPHPSLPGPCPIQAPFLTAS